MQTGMTKGERTELGSLIRKREKVMKAAARERSAQLLAEFDTQSAQIYKFDDDEIWKQATLEHDPSAVNRGFPSLLRGDSNCRPEGGWRG